MMCIAHRDQFEYFRAVQFWLCVRCKNSAPILLIFRVALAERTGAEVIVQLFPRLNPSQLQTTVMVIPASPASFRFRENWFFDLLNQLAIKGLLLVAEWFWRMESGRFDGVMRSRMHRWRFFRRAALGLWLGAAIGQGVLQAQEIGSPPLFSEEDFVSTDIGELAIPGSFAAAEGGFDVTGGGENIGERADQLHFVYHSTAGDFDVRVRIDSVTFVDVWTKAGLMVRESLEPGSLQACVLATPTISGVFFQSRTRTRAESTGSHRVNYPFTWLRLKREGERISGFAGFDGVHWSLLGSAHLALSEEAFLGLAVSSHSSEAAAIAKFRDFGHAGMKAKGAIPYGVEPPGPSSRRTGLTITEIMYHPPERGDGRDLEFVELMNTDAIPHDVSGFQLDGSIAYEFPEGIVLPPGSIVVVAKSPGDLAAVPGVLGSFERSLPDDAGTVRLRDRQGAVLLEAIYDSSSPWPASPGGAGHSLVLSRPSYGERSVKAWSASAFVGGSPGAMDPVRLSNLHSVAINEFLANSAPSELDFVELYNRGNEAVNLSGAVLTDDPLLAKYRFPRETVIPARGFLLLTESSLGFALRSSGEAVYFLAGDGAQVVDALRFAGQSESVSSGRFPDGAPEVRELAARTPGSGNAGWLIRDIVINEIMYHPPSGENDDEYIEIFNWGTSRTDLSGWRLDGGVRFTFPEGTQIPPGRYLTVARNAARLIQNYPQLNADNTAGNYQGSLSNRGERIVLLRPESRSEAEESAVFVAVDQVEYADGGAWGRWADGGGSSLELRDPNSDNRRASNWADSDETAKSEWTTVEHTGQLEQGRGPINDFQIFLQGAGECLVDDVEFIDDEGVNYVSEGTFGNATLGRRGNWLFQGTHQDSVIQTGDSIGFESDEALRIVASARGDNGANRIRFRIRSPYPKSSSMATIRAKVRWLRGHPEILFRAKGNYLEAIGKMQVPANLGTPGLKNSRAEENAGPAIFDVAHWPVLPREGEAVRVSARVEDAQGVSNVQLRYRIDPDEAIQTIPMKDDGTSGDEAAGDGVYSAAIAGQADGAVIAFSIAAVDRAEAAASASFPRGGRECLAAVGEEQPHGNFGVYHIWLTDAVGDEWRRRLKLHNGDLDCTFVYGNHRVVYNAGTLYSGSPWLSPGYSGPTGTLCGYVLHFPKDDRVLGATDFVLDWPIRDSSYQLEQVAFWIAEQMGLPYLRRRNIHLFVNGRRRGRIYEDVQQPNADVMAQFHSHQQRGDLYKIEDWFEFNSGGVKEFNVDANLLSYTNFVGEKHLPRYRYNWRKRAIRGSAHDYSSLFNLVDALNLPPSDAYTKTVESLVDVKEWMGIFAVEHIVGNWDAYGYGRGKNMYAYKPLDGKWTLHMWDIDFVLGANSDDPESSMFSTNEPVIRQMYVHPPFARLYYQAMQKAVDGPLQASKSTPVLEANQKAFLEHGVRAGSIRTGERYIAQRRKYLQEQIAFQEAPFEILTNNGETFSLEQNFASLTGRAPLAVQFIAVNGVRYPIRWQTVNTWQMNVPLAEAENSLLLRGYADTGESVENAAAQITIHFQGALDSPQERLVIHEIMHQPEQEGAEFVEIHNASAHTVFPLAHYRLDGVGFDFPQNAVIQPGDYQVIVANRNAYSTAYGGDGSEIAGEFEGRLRPEGETLRLIFADSQTGRETIVDEVTFGATTPWPALANGGGSSLQLIDPDQDNDRVGNWTAVGAEERPQGWTLASATGTASGSTLLLYLSGNPPIREFEGILGRWSGYFETFGANREEIAFRFESTSTGKIAPIFISEGQEFPLASVEVDGQRVKILWGPLEGSQIWFEGSLSEDGLSLSGNLIQVLPENRYEFPFTVRRVLPGGNAYLDDVVLVAGDIPEQGENLVQNGSFESDLSDGWQVAPNHASSQIVDTFQHTGQKSLRIAAPVGGWNAGTAISQNLEGLKMGEQYTLRFRYLAGSAGEGLTVALEGFGLARTVDIRPSASRKTTQFTPGFQNAGADSLPPFPTIRINELQTANSGSFQDAAGEVAPWLELYNHGTEPASLNGFHLNPGYDPSTSWNFPPGAAIPPGGYQIIWLDGEPEETTVGEWHANFRPNAEGGFLLLARSMGEQTIIADYVDYPEIPSGQSLGLFPDGRANSQQRLFTPTPGAANTIFLPEIRVFINEWMAQNTTTIADPAKPTGAEFDDWFELYNADSEPADLSGFFLSDDPDNPNRYPIPNGYIIPPQGFLLVWADDQPEQNGLTADLHVNFKLSRSGESIGLYGPDGAAVDSVQFGPQTADVAEGRSQDGAGEPFVSLPNPSPGTSNAEFLLAITEIQITADGRLRIAFTTQPGKRYQARYTNALDNSKWRNWGEPILADGRSAAVFDAAAPQEAQRFYTIKQLEE